MNKKTALLIIAFFTGFVCDAILQFLSRFMGGHTGWGLIPYFRQHGSIESLFIASGMMVFFYILFLYVFNLEPTWLYLIIYGVLLDLLFRKFQIFPSLKQYYIEVNYFWSAFWGAIPMILPLIIYKLFFSRNVQFDMS